MVITELKQLEQVDNLMVSPITDVRPRVLGFNHLPVNTFVRDTIGIIPVCGGGIEELGDDMIDEKRVGNGERFPVLEYIPPVTLIRHDGIALLVLHADVEQVPRT